ncbi:MAG TPA: iron export ABC transporter permease subunit FetB [Myxococcota bacterium]|nr:iron export ABC transporter permease subunit FetB [Myxococcota bacterium]
MTGPIELSLLDLAGAASLIAINGVLSLWLRLDLGRKLAVASVRTVVQLLILGYVLVPVFDIAHPALVMGLGGLMVILAGRAAIKRTSRTYSGAWGIGLVAMTVGAIPTTILATAVLIGVEPFWAPRYFIPLLGMVLGNALTGVSLGIDRALEGFVRGRSQVELLLSFGASRWEAAREVAADAVRTGMIPILNTMTVVGLVTIPGMMTGQILGGAPPEVAARYQILIMFLIAGAVGIGTVVAVLLTVRAVFDELDRLRVDRVRAS